MSQDKVNEIFYHFDQEDAKRAAEQAARNAGSYDDGGGGTVAMVIAGVAIAANIAKTFFGIGD